MDLTQLETFLAVAEERSFSRAAVRLHRTQPAVSQAVAKLEAELGETLFERSMRDGTLTDAGELLREYATKLLNLRAEAAGALVELRALHRGRLNLGANEYTCLCLLPLLSEFRRAHPEVKLTVQRSLASRIPDEVLMHTVELGVVSFRADDPQLVSTLIYRDELACVVNSAHELAREGVVSIRRLRGYSFVAHNVPSPQRQKVVQAFRQHKATLGIAVELPSIEAIKRFVEISNGVALVPGLSVQAELRAGSLVKVAVPELQMERTLRLVHRREASLSHAAVAFLEVARRHAERQGEPFLFAEERRR